MNWSIPRKKVSVTPCQFCGVFDYTVWHMDKEDLHWHKKCLVKTVLELKGGKNGQDKS